jgi:hypothetical protein
MQFSAEYSLLGIEISHIIVLILNDEDFLTPVSA